MKVAHDLAKLPRWARWEIERLTADLAAANEKLAAGPDDSDTFADPYSETARPLGKSPTIEFRFGGGWHEKIQARLDGNSLIVSTAYGMKVLPKASNVIEVEVTHNA